DRRQHQEAAEDRQVLHRVDHRIGAFGAHRYVPEVMEKIGGHQRKHRQREAAHRVCHPSTISRPPPSSNAAVAIASTCGIGRPFEPIAAAVEGKSIIFSSPDEIKMTANTMRPIASRTSLTPAIARISVSGARTI